MKFENLFLIIVILLGSIIIYDLNNVRSELKNLKDQQKIQKEQHLKEIDSIKCKTDSVLYHVKQQDKFIDSLSKYNHIVKQNGCLPSVFIAQAIIESGMGQSQLTKQSKNLFCIKGSYNGQFVLAKDDEPGLSKFRKYPTFEHSVFDYINLMQTDRYCDLLYNNCYKTWAKQLKKKGYASSSVYTQRLILTIEKYNLQVFDVI